MTKMLKRNLEFGILLALNPLKCLRGGPWSNYPLPMDPHLSPDPKDFTPFMPNSLLEYLVLINHISKRQQLNDLKQDYLSKEDLRKKQVQELEQMIGQLDEMSVHQNPNLKVHENHIKKTKEELNKAEQPTPVPIPHFSSEDLQSLLQLLERMGTVLEINQICLFVWISLIIL